jgi:hypothetical protein
MNTLTEIRDHPRRTIWNGVVSVSLTLSLVIMAGCGPYQSVGTGMNNAVLALTSHD